MDLREKRGEDHQGYHDSSNHGDWLFGSNPQAGFFIPSNTSCVPFCADDQMGSSPTPAFAASGSFGRALHSQNPSFSDTAAQGNHLLPPKGCAFFPNGAGILPPGLSQFPADSGFIERAARFSCFNGVNVNVGGMVSAFSAHGSSIPLFNAQRNALSRGEALKDASMPVDNISNLGSPLRHPRGNESSEQEFSVGGQEEGANSDNTAGEPSPIGFGSRKRKRGNQAMELDQSEGDNQISVGTSKENPGGKRKGEQENSISPAAKPSGKHGKDSADAPKEDYVHVRARRGQATNSHSLAERVRREKISERMKFLQDLVPGCSKVTGKAVMLDEIINYVQSLQRQVEFLSMKLAAVNPLLDINIEGLLSKEILQSRAVSSTTIGFSPDMAHTQLHPAQQPFDQSGIPSMANPSDALRRAINAQLTAINAYRDPTNQVQIPNAWGTELQNVVQMGFGSNATPSIQELHGLPPPGHVKIEP